MAHLGSTQDDNNPRPLRFKGSDKFSGLNHIPDVHAKANDLGPIWQFRPQLTQQFMHHALHGFCQSKFGQSRQCRQFGAAMARHVGHEVTKS